MPRLSLEASVHSQRPLPSMHRKTIDVSSGAAARVRRGAAESAGGLGGLAEPHTSPRSHCRQTGDLGTAGVPWASGTPPPGRPHTGPDDGGTFRDSRAVMYFLSKIQKKKTLKFEHVRPSEFCARPWGEIRPYFRSSTWSLSTDNLGKEPSSHSAQPLLNGETEAQGGSHN